METAVKRFYAASSLSKIESTSIVLSRLRIRFSDIQLEETANRNFTGQHYRVIDIQLLVLFLLFDAIMASSVTSPYKSLLINLPSPPSGSREAPTKRVHTKSYKFW